MIHKRASKIAIATFMPASSILLLNVRPVPRIGLIGAAIATTVSYGGIVVFLAYQSLRVLPYKLDLFLYARYIASRRRRCMARRPLPVETPLVSAVVKGSLILVLYAGILFAIDKRVRELLTNIWTAMTGWLHSSGEPVLKPISAFTERT